MKKLTGLLCALALFSPVPVLAIPNYIFHDLGVPSGAFSLAYGINESGQVAGISGDHAVIWENGTATILGLGYATDINDFGQVVGGQNGAVLWENGIMTNLEAPGGERSWSSGINNLGQVSIYSPTADDNSAPYHAYVWDPENGITDLDTTSYSYAYDINDSGIVVGRLGPGLGTAASWENGTLTQYPELTTFAGVNNFDQMVGWVHDAFNDEAVLWDNGEVTMLGYLGSGYHHSSASAINDRGQIVGTSADGGYDNELSFIWEYGQIYDLNDLIINSIDGLILTNARDINNSGQIVGTAELNGVRHGFLLDPVPAPVPEPSTILLVATGLIGLAGFRKKFKK